MQNRRQFGAFALAALLFPAAALAQQAAPAPGDDGEHRRRRQSGANGQPVDDGQPRNNDQPGSRDGGRGQPPAGGEQQGRDADRRRRRDEEAADASMPSDARIEQQLNAEPPRRWRREQRVTIQEFKRRPDLRRVAPSVDIQAINFEFGSDVIPESQFRKVDIIARALRRMLRRRPDMLILIEGHTDAVGSASANQALSERRADSLRRLLVRRYDIPRRNLEAVGYGEEFLLVPTQYEEWRNRRVTLRRVDEFVR